MENLPKIIKDIKDFLLEFILWIILIPKTLTMIIVYPSFISPYIKEEIAKENESKVSFTKFINPIFLWILMIGIPAISYHKIMINFYTISNPREEVAKSLEKNNNAIINLSIKIDSLIENDNSSSLIDTTYHKIDSIHKNNETIIKNETLRVAKKFDSLPFSQQLTVATITQLLYPLGFIITFLILFPSHYKREKIKMILYNQLYILTPYILGTVLLSIVLMSYMLKEYFGKIGDDTLTIATLILIFAVTLTTYFCFLRTQFLFIKNHFFRKQEKDLNWITTLGILILSFFVASCMSIFYTIYLIKVTV